MSLEQNQAQTYTEWAEEKLLPECLQERLGPDMESTVHNDPRIFLDNVLARRLGAFDFIMASATLLASLAGTALLWVQTPDQPQREVFAVVLFVAIFCANLFCLTVLTTQNYQVWKLITCSPFGFEIAKTYYLDDAVMTLRHIGTYMFFWSIPLLSLAVAFVVWHRLCPAANDSEAAIFGGIKNAPACLPKSFRTVICVILVLSAVLLARVNQRQRGIFKEKYELTKTHEDPYHHSTHHQTAFESIPAGF